MPQKLLVVRVEIKVHNFFLRDGRGYFLRISVRVLQDLLHQFLEASIFGRFFICFQALVRVRVRSVAKGSKIAPTRTPQSEKSFKYNIHPLGTLKFPPEISI